MYAQENSSSRAITGLLVVVIVHVAFFVALKSGLAAQLIDAVPPPIEAFVIEFSKPKPVPPEPVKLQRAEPQLDPVPIPEVPIPAVEDPIEVTVPEVAPSEPVDSAPTSSELQVDSRYPLTAPEYPAISRRMNEQGTVLLEIYVLPNGTVGDVKVARSSGFPRLDTSAIREAKRSWRFLPGSFGGQAVAGWGRFSVSFRLDD